MYCVQCGVELSDSQERCPLCGTVVFHPEIVRKQEDKPYPPKPRPQTASRFGILFVLTMLILLPLVTVLLVDWRINDNLSWSGYVVGALVVAYVVVVLPMWFKKATPIIFLGADHVALGLYLLYINYATGGDWYLTFALPLLGGLMLLSMGALTLLYYVPKGALYTIGGTLLLLGWFTVLIEYLINYTFHLSDRFFWSFYPLAGCSIIGITLLVIAICPGFQEGLRRKFFI